MRKVRVLNNVVPHIILILGVVFMLFPVYIAFIGSTHDSATIGRGLMPLTPGSNFPGSYVRAWEEAKGHRVIGTPVRIMLVNSLIVAICVALGKILVSSLTAYAIVYFNFPLKNFFFWAIFITLMLPLEIRIFSTYKLAADFRLLNTYPGLALPLMVSATGTLLLRQAFRSIPRELLDSARVDGAGPLRSFWSVVLPVVRPNLAALFVILFIYGWNQYLWPLLITTRREMQTIVIGIVKMMGGPEALVDWDIVMASTIMATIVPVLVVLWMQRWLIKGLTETDK